MIHKLSSTIALYLVKNGADSENTDIYTYGAECLINELISDFLLIAAAILFHCVPTMLIWIIFFTLLRTKIGGFHASKHVYCILYSEFVGVFFAVLAKYSTYNPVYIFVALIACALLIYKTAPVTHPNHPIKEEKKKRIRKSAFLVFLIQTLLIFVLPFIKIIPTSYIMACFYGIVSSVLLMIIGYYSTPQNVKKSM